LTKSFLFDYIKKYRFAVISTLSSDGFPQSAYVGFAITADLTIIFDTATDSRKYRNLLADPRISLVIGGEDEQTIQYEGLAQRPGTRLSHELMETYFAVFPEGRQRVSSENIAYFVVRPRWIRYSNFTVGRQKIEEISFPSDDI
jgi:pyridoxine/pyridoxamine 5'-phosphate oxidase